jgi:hypothetical protein
LCILAPPMSPPLSRLAITAQSLSVPPLQYPSPPHPVSRPQTPCPQPVLPSKSFLYPILKPPFLIRSLVYRHPCPHSVLLSKNFRFPVLKPPILIRSQVLRLPAPCPQTNGPCLFLSPRNRSPHPVPSLYLWSCVPRPHPCPLPVPTRPPVLGPSPGSCPVFRFFSVLPVFFRSPDSS